MSIDWFAVRPVRTIGNIQLQIRNRTKMILVGKITMYVNHNNSPPPVVGLLAILSLAMLAGCGNGPQTGAAPFDPANFKELEIKGARPDGKSSWSAIAVPAEPIATDASRAKGKELFSKACTGCHGVEGKGDGAVPKNADLPTRPADLTAPVDSIKIRSTFSIDGSVPTGTDLFRTITRGIPGTGMWSFAALPPEDRWALVQYLKTLSLDYANSADQPVAIPPKVPRDAAALAHGSQIVSTVCYNCHGLDGMGGRQALIDPETRKPFLGLSFARDGGISTLGGSSEEDLARTIMCGFHRRSMMRGFKPSIYDTENPSPAQKAEMDRKFWGVVYYTRDLIEKQNGKQ